MSLLSSNGTCIHNHNTELNHATLSEPLSLAWKREIAHRLWGLDLTSLSRTAKYNSFFEYYQSYVAGAEQASRSRTWLQNHGILFRVILAIKANIHLTRADLRNVLEGIANGEEDSIAGRPTMGAGQLSYGTLTHLTLQASVDVKSSSDLALATVIGAMFAININLSPGRILVGQSNLEWQEDQSFETLIHETFPIFDHSDEPHSPIMSNKLRARYLESYADVRIEWTRHLADHLKLDLGPRTKILRVFDLVSLLEMTYETLKNEPWEIPLSESLKHGCYEASFLYETLQTILLLFPTQDRQWLDQKIHHDSSWLFWKAKTKQHIDPRLSAPFQCHHGGKAYNRPLTTRRELFSRYPHWAVRLHILYAEAEDPAPVSWFGRWAERRRAARHTFSLTLVALIAAASFGIVATVLSIVQIWISYCDWKGTCP